MSELVAKRKKRSFGYKIKKFADIYRSTDEYLGEGSCGTVRTFYNIEKEKEFAVKIVESTSKRVRKKVLKEIEILHHCKAHPNITQLHEFYEEDHKFYLVFEKMEGLTLLDWMERHGGMGGSGMMEGNGGMMGEEGVARVARELATGLNFLHHKGVAHRDLKLENVLCTSLHDIHPVKICDFDLSTDFGGSGGNGCRGSGDGGVVSGSPGYGSGSETCQPMENINLNELASAVGSVDYMAPEVVRVWLNEDCTYSEQCDIWSLGVVLYILLCGYKPFGGSRSDLCCCSSTQTLLQCEYCKEEHFEQIKEGVVEMGGPLWAGVSEGAKNLISRLLVKDPHKRLTAWQVLSHPWVLDSSVFTHAKSSPISFHPIQIKRQVVSGNQGCTSHSTDSQGHYSNDNSFNNTLVEESFCHTLADRIFSLELEDEAGGGDGVVVGGSGEVLDVAGGEVVVGDGEVVACGKVDGSSDVVVSGSGDKEVLWDDDEVLCGNEEDESDDNKSPTSSCGETQEQNGVVVDGGRSGDDANEFGDDDGEDCSGKNGDNESGGGGDESKVDGESGGDKSKVDDGSGGEKWLMFGSCDSGNGSGVSLTGSPCILANNPLNSHNNNPLSNHNNNPLNNHNNIPLNNHNNIPLNNHNNNPLNNHNNIPLNNPLNKPLNNHNNIPLNNHNNKSHNSFANNQNVLSNNHNFHHRRVDGGMLELGCFLNEDGACGDGVDGSGVGGRGVGGRGAEGACGGGGDGVFVGENEKLIPFMKKKKDKKFLPSNAVAQYNNFNYYNNNNGYGNHHYNNNNDYQKHNYHNYNTNYNYQNNNQNIKNSPNNYRKQHYYNYNKKNINRNNYNHNFCNDEVYNNSNNNSNKNYAYNNNNRYNYKVKKPAYMNNL